MSEPINVPSKSSDVPYYDHHTAKFIGLYERNKTLNVLARLDSVSLRMTSRMLASALTPLLNPPSQIVTYCCRVINIHQTPALRKALEDEVVSCRYALDISNYVKNARYKEVTDRAISGEINNKTFRQLVKELKKS